MAAGLRLPPFSIRVSRLQTPARDRSRVGIGLSHRLLFLLAQLRRDNSTGRAAIDRPQSHRRVNRRLVGRVELADLPIILSVEFRECRRE